MNKMITPSCHFFKGSRGKHNKASILIPIMKKAIAVFELV
jgi:hypothetical protein